MLANEVIKKNNYQENYPTIRFFKSTNSILASKKKYKKRKKKRKKFVNKTSSSIKDLYSKKNSIIKATSALFKPLNKIGNSILTACKSLDTVFLGIVAGVTLIGVALVKLKEGLDSGELTTGDYGDYGDYGGYTGEEYSGTGNTVRVKNKIIAEAKKQGVDPALALAMAEHESGFNQKARSNAGAIGVFQLMPRTAQELGVNPNDEDDNIRGGIKYLKKQLDLYKNRPDQVDLALASYNAGAGAVDNTRRDAKGNIVGDYNISKLGSETRNYVPSIKANISKFRKQLEQNKERNKKALENLKNVSGLKPWGKERKITEEFGARINPISGEREFHKGIDLAYNNGDAIYSFTDGIVVFAGEGAPYEGFGNVVSMEWNGYAFLYAHLSKIAPNIHSGVKVLTGQLIGWAGSTGYSTGPHLHFAIYKGKYIPGSGKEAENASVNPIGFDYSKFQDSVKEREEANKKNDNGKATGGAANINQDEINKILEESDNIKKLDSQQKQLEALKKNPQSEQHTQTKQFNSQKPQNTNPTPPAGRPANKRTGSDINSRKPLEILQQNNQNYIRARKY